MTQPPDKAKRMTEEEIERYRRFLRLGSSLASDEADKLLDALTAAYAELDALRENLDADRAKVMRLDAKVQQKDAALDEARSQIERLKEDMKRYDGFKSRWSDFTNATLIKIQEQKTEYESQLAQQAALLKEAREKLTALVEDKTVDGMGANIRDHAKREGHPDPLVGAKDFLSSLSLHRSQQEGEK